MRFLIRLLIRLGWTKYFNLRFEYTYNKLRIIIPVINGLGKENLFLSELWMLEVMSHLISSKEGVFVDVGVNVGQTLIKLRSINRDVKYIGFEPNPACVYYSNELIKANRFRNTIVVPAGISDEDHLLILNFYSDGDLDSSASIVKDFRPQRIFRKEYVACLRYDSFRELLDNESICVLKIDVEGAELQVLKSFFTVLREKRPFVMIEILPAYNIENKERIQRQQEIQAMMKTLHYSIFRIHGSKPRFTKLDQIEINPAIEECNYLLCPDENTSVAIPI